MVSFRSDVPPLLLLIKIGKDQWQKSETPITLEYKLEMTVEMW